MGTAPRLESRPIMLSQQWQFPLLLAAATLFAIGIVRLVPAIPKPKPADPLDAVHHLVHSGHYSDAFVEAKRVLALPKTDAKQRIELHRIAAQCVFAVESKLAKHLPDNGAILIEHLKAVAHDGGKLSAGEQLSMAEAYTWLGRPAIAAASYEDALRAGCKGASAVRRKLIGLIDRGAGGESQDAEQYVKEILADKHTEPGDLYWALQRQIAEMLEDKKGPAAEKLIAEMAPRLAGSPYKPHLRYELARCLAAQGKNDEANRILRDLLNGPGPKDDLWAKAVLMLANLELNDGRPETALSLFEDVRTMFPHGQRNLESEHGRAECFVALERLGEAQAVFKDLVERETDASRRDVLRVRLTTLSEQMTAAGRQEMALTFTRMATRLVEPSDEDRRSIYDMAIADLGLQLAPHEKDAKQRKALYREAGRALEKFGETSLRNEGESAAALWRAMLAFDAAGDGEHTAEILERFVRQRLTDPHRAEGLRRLGDIRARQGALRKAAATFEELVTDYPRTPEGLHAVIRWAACLSELDKASVAKAEKLLLSIVEQSPQSEALFDPRAPEYVEALYRLAEIYAAAGRYEDAIYRLETLDALPADPNVPRPRVRYLLADCYRLSGRLLAADAVRTSNADMRDRIVKEARARTEKAAGLYALATDVRGMDDAKLSAVEESQVRAAWLHRADCLFDLARYGDAREIYSEAAWRFDGEYTGLMGLLGVVHCQQRAGQVKEARSTLARMQVLCRRMPEKAFAAQIGGISKADWQMKLAQFSSEL